jgi:two-component system, chemotaxis family, sensor kinase CheA
MTARRLDQATDAVADIVHRLRLRPFADVCEACPVPCGTWRRRRPQVELELEGQDVEADRMVIDALRDRCCTSCATPWTTASSRRTSASGAASRGSAGSGSAPTSLPAGWSSRFPTTAAGWTRPPSAKRSGPLGRPVPTTDAELADAVIAGGFSTREEATEISGRGVGVDIVRAAVQRMGGAVDVRWKTGQGTTFFIECPPTPATIRALMVRVGAHRFAIPSAHVERVQRISKDDIRQVDGRSVIALADGPVPVHTLAAVLGPPLEAHPFEGTALAAIVSAGSRRAALVVDEALDEDEVVVRPLDIDEGAVPHALGGAILPTGTVALVLAAPVLLAAGARSGTAIAPSFAMERDAPRRRVLVADDSITTRTLEQSVLESAGYDVITAVNGEDAWQKLEREGADMVVADVEMPRMDGFGLCRRIRASERFKALPIALVTGLSSDEDRARGLEAGADAYIVKSSFDQATLLETVQQLIGDS